MAARVVYFGCDECRRVPVLHMAGYAVDDCPSILKLRSVLQEPGQTSAFLFTGRNEKECKEAVVLARTQSSAPLILFDGPNHAGDESDFDLVIPPLTPPQEWLAKIAATIQQRRSMH